MKKLQLNKETIARLNNPERIMGGEKTKPSFDGPPQTCALINASCAGAPNCQGDATNTFTITLPTK